MRRCSLCFRWREKKVHCLILLHWRNKCKTIKKFKLKSWPNNYKMIKISSYPKIIGSIIIILAIFRVIGEVTDSKILGLHLKISKKKMMMNFLLEMIDLRPLKSSNNIKNKTFLKVIMKLPITTVQAPASHLDSSKEKVHLPMIRSTAKTKKANLW